MVKFNYTSYFRYIWLFTWERCAAIPFHLPSPLHNLPIQHVLHSNSLVSRILNVWSLFVICPLYYLRSHLFTSFLLILYFFKFWFVSLICITLNPSQIMLGLVSYVAKLSFQYMSSSPQNPPFSRNDNCLNCRISYTTKKDC